MSKKYTLADHLKEHNERVESTSAVLGGVTGVLTCITGLVALKTIPTDGLAFIFFLIAVLIFSLVISALVFLFSAWTGMYQGEK